MAGKSCGKFGFISLFYRRFFTTFVLFVSYRFHKNEHGAIVLRKRSKMEHIRLACKSMSDSFSSRFTS